MMTNRKEINDLGDISKPVKDLVHKRDPDEHVFVTVRSIGHQNVNQSLTLESGKEFWHGRGYVSIVQVHHIVLQIVKVQAPVEIAKDDIIPQFVIQPQMHQGQKQV